jgi:hypothetical protein
MQINSEVLSSFVFHLVANRLWKQGGNVNFNLDEAKENKNDSSSL